VPTPLQSLARLLGEAAVLVQELVPVVAAHAAPIARLPAPRDVVRVLVSAQSTPSTPSAPGARLSSSVAQVIEALHELLVPRPAASAAEAPEPAPATASLAALPTPLPAQLEQRLQQLPAPLQACLAEVVAQLRNALAPALLNAAADEVAPLVAGRLLAQLEAAVAMTGAPAGLGVPHTPLETMDAYRWGLLVGLNFRPALGRPARALVSSARPRCELCGRLLEQSRSGALVCPTC
jgi:hypothetical protein